MGLGKDRQTDTKETDRTDICIQVKTDKDTKHEKVVGLRQLLNNHGVHIKKIMR